MVFAMVISENDVETAAELIDSHLAREGYKRTSPVKYVGEFHPDFAPDLTMHQYSVETDRAA